MPTPAGTLHLDDVSGSQLNQTGLTGRVARGFTVTDLDATSISDSTLMFTARDTALAGAGATYPGQPDYKLSEIIIRGITHNGFEGQLIYEMRIDLQPSVFIIRDRSYLQTEQTVFCLATKEIMRVDWNSGAASIPEDTVHMTVPLPMRAISFTASRFGRPPDNLGGSVGMVNDSTYNGYDTGFWLIVEATSDVLKFQNAWSYSATIITKTIIPWYHVGILQSSVTGKHAKIDPADWATQLGSAYQVGVQKFNGFIIAGHYRTTNFPALFPNL